MKPNFWQGRRVFLTGHTGFKGSWLSLWLQSMGADLTGYALPPSTVPSLFDVAEVGSGMKSIFGDVRDFELLKKTLRDSQAEVIFHMAAQPLVRYSYQNPIETYSTNVIGTVNLFEAVRLTGQARAVINITTDKCYKNNEWVWGYRETDTLGGYDPYSSSKACSELVTDAMRSSYFNDTDYERHGVTIASARAGTVVGGGDWSEDRLIPDIIRSIIQKKPVHIRNPASVRPWQHVLDPLCGYLTLAERMYEFGPEYSGAWNFGPSEDDKTVLSIVKRLADLFGDVDWDFDNKTNPHESFSLRLDCSKSRTKLGWHPKWEIEMALQKIVEWHMSFNIGKSIMKDICLRQISDYSER